jgi:hypothetical protein
MTAQPGAGETIQLTVEELNELFAWMDPTPLPHRDLDEDVARWIVSWAEDLRDDQPPAIEIQIQNEVDPVEAGALEETFHRYFRREAEFRRRELGRLLRDGRISLLIGVAALAGFQLLSTFLGRVGQSPFTQFLQEGAAIAGWVAMWRPMEMLLYDWWPIRRLRNTYLRLASSPVRVVPA